MEKVVFSILKTVFNSIALAGVVILMLGLYYLVIKAGIPYQDPTMEMQIEYAVNSGIGNELSLVGTGMAAFGTVVRVVLGLVQRLQK
ncbi:MAG: hypothetical protein J5684_07870 [Eubacterium sp.]|nr:hypothetical protein [Eubacterium sp.]